MDMVLRTVNTVCGKWKSGKTIIIGYKLVLAIEYHSLKPLAFRFTLSSVTKLLLLVSFWLALLFLWVSRIKEAYKGLLNGDILEGVIILT